MTRRQIELLANLRTTLTQIDQVRRLTADNTGRPRADKRPWSQQRLIDAAIEHRNLLAHTILESGLHPDTTAFLINRSRTTVQRWARKHQQP